MADSRWRVHGLRLPDRNVWLGRVRSELICLNMPTDILVLVAEYGSTFSIAWLSKDPEMRARNCGALIARFDQIFQFDPKLAEGYGFTASLTCRIGETGILVDRLSDGTWHRRLCEAKGIFPISCDCRVTGMVCLNAAIASGVPLPKDAIDFDRYDDHMCVNIAFIYYYHELEADPGQLIFTDDIF